MHDHNPPKREWTAALLGQVLDYDPYTGLFRWKLRPDHLFSSAKSARTFNTMWSGKSAISKIEPTGYLAGKIFSQSVRAHRVAWLMTHDVWPEQVDHINGNRSDNRIVNLRACTPTDNQRNLTLRKDTRHKVFGIRLSSGCTDSWQATICVAGKKHALGSFKTVDLAIAARLAAERLYGFHENHGRETRRGLA